MNGGQSIGKAQVLFPVRRCHGGCHGVNSDEMEISRRTNVYQNQQTCLICSPQPKSMGHVTGAAKPDLALQPPAPSSSSSHPSHPILSLSLSPSLSLPLPSTLLVFGSVTTSPHSTLHQLLKRRRYPSFFPRLSSYYAPPLLSVNGDLCVFEMDLSRQEYPALLVCFPSPTFSSSPRRFVLLVSRGSHAF